MPKDPLLLDYATALRALPRAGIDECKAWADRAAAMAVYARQTRSLGFQETARRINLRARIRIGELLLAIPDARVKGRHKSDPGSRRQTIMRHGLPDAIPCIAMARVPKRTREKLIEASPPVTPSTLAQLGTRTRTTPENRFHGGVAYRLAIGMHNEGLGGFVRWIRRHPARKLARQLTRAEAARVSQHVQAADEWIDEFVRALKG